MSIDGSLRLNSFMRCPSCRRIHVATLVGPNTVCHCGLNLYLAAWSR